MRHLPRFTYSGLTIILSNPSRFDRQELLSANGGLFFTNECLYPHTTRFACDIRLTTCREPLLAGTKGVLLLGSRAMEQWLPPEVVANNTLHELRGSPYTINGVPHIASYLPQDCVDIQDHEKRLNLLSHDAPVGLADDKVREDETGQGEKKRHATTLRTNFRFWLQKDTKKILRIIQEYEGNIPYKEESRYEIYPRAETVIKLLSETKGKMLFFDMETFTDATGNIRITCFAFAFDISTVYVVPLFRHDYSLAYDPPVVARIFRSLAVALRDNCTVAHNGHGFDFFVLSRFYSIPIGRRVYDTMLAQHRIFPDVEKSLGHCVSLWTHEPYHKDEIQFAFGSAEQANRLWLYCGKDVSTMIRIYEAQQNYARGIPGLVSSIEQVNASIRPYLTTTLTGISYNTRKIAETLSENDRLCTQYLRMIRILIGSECSKRIKPKSKTAVECMATSNPQCTAYFHRELGYKVVGYGKLKRDGTKSPSLAEKLMLKLRLQHNNPVIDFCLAFRQAAKESSSLKFLPLNWR